MRHFSILLILSCVFLLAGCPATIQTVYKTKLELVSPPDELIVKCESDTPPNKLAYVASPAEEKERLLVDYANNQTTNLRKCSSTVESIRNWKNKQLAIFKEKEAKETKPKE